MSCSAFNNLLTQFVAELAEVFPEHSRIKVAERALEDLIAVNAQLPMQKYIELMGPHAQAISARDGSMFKSLNLFQIDLGMLWETEDLSEVTRDAVWKYVSTLWTLATVMTSMPPELLSSIEQISQEVAAEFDGGEEPDMGKVIARMMSSMGPLMSAFGGGVFGGPQPARQNSTPRQLALTPPDSSSGAGSSGAGEAIVKAPKSKKH